MSYAVENTVKWSQNKLWLKKERERERKERKTDGGIKSRQEWELCTGGMDGWVAAWMMENLFVLQSFPHILMTWQWICTGCLLLDNAHTQVLNARSNPTPILHLPRSTLCFHNV